MSGAETESATANQPKRRWRHYAWRTTRNLLIIYVGLIIVLYMLQTWMIFPGHATQGQAHAIVRDGQDYELLTLQTTGGDRIAAVFGKALSDDGQILPDSRDRPTILFFYGNGMCMADAMGEFRTFRKLGANVIIPDFAGYGMSGGKPSEKSFYATADACWEHLMSRDDIDKQRIVASGWSLGAAVAIDLAHRKPVSGLAIFSAFTSTGDMAHNLLPWLPTSMLIKHKFESERKIRQIDVPVLIVHGKGDQIIPYDMCERLSKAAKGPVTALSVESDHNDLFDAGAYEILPAFERFLHSSAKSSPAND